MLTQDGEDDLGIIDSTFMGGKAFVGALVRFFHRGNDQGRAINHNLRRQVRVGLQPMYVGIIGWKTSHDKMVENEKT